MILLLLGGVLLLAAAHPFLTYPLSLALAARRREAVAPLAAAARPQVAICMSVYNEEAVIVDKVETLLRQAAFYGPASINIYADGCSDRTVALLAPYADRINLIVSPARSGKTVGMRALIASTSAEVLMFTDANVIAPDSAVADLVAPLADPEVGCVTAQLIYSNRRESATSAVGALYWRIEEFIKRMEDHAMSLIGVDGAMFVIRRTHYHAPPANLIDDLYVSLKVLLDGKRVTRAPQVLVRERSATASSEEFRRKARIACQAMNVHRALWPALRRLPPMLVYGYLSHRLIKWLMPFLLLGAGLCFVAAIALWAGALTTLALIGAGAVLLWLGTVAGLRPAGFVWATVTGLAGVARGVLESLFTHQTYTVWEPASSVRSNAAEE